MDRVEQLSALLGGRGRVSRRERAGDAVTHVVVEDAERQAVERGAHSRELREEVDAVAVLVDHPLDATHLALDAVEAAAELRLVVVVPVLVRVGHIATPWRELRNRRRRRLFARTKRLEQAIAAAATIGLRNPAMASGIAATL